MKLLRLHLVASGACVTVLLALAQGPASAILLDFDEVAEGTVLTDLYSDQGVHMEAIIGFLTNDVIAAVPCTGEASPPHVMNIFELGECPAMNDNVGFLQIRFDRPVDRIALTVLHTQVNAISYIEVYSDADYSEFIDFVWGIEGQGGLEAGVPHVLEFSPAQGEPPIRSLKLGAWINGGRVWFDDLEFDLTVPNQASSWGTIKARYGR